MNLLVLQGGLQTTVQDLGRFGYQRYGVSVDGAGDAFAARLLNLLVGNPPEGALLEMALVGPELQVDSTTLIAWCGAEFEPRLGNAILPACRPVRVASGEIVTFGSVRKGARAWVALAGGIDVPPVLASRSTSVPFKLGGVDGRPLGAGDRLVMGTPSHWAQRIIASLDAARQRHCSWSVHPHSLGYAPPERPLRALRGPEWDWFAPESQRTFFGAKFEVTKDADRIGARLRGPGLLLREPREMISTAVDTGVVQVPPGGQPIVLLCGRQTIGGYPRIASVATLDHGRLAQLTPGETISFEEITIAKAHELYLARERKLYLVRDEISRRTG